MAKGLVKHETLEGIADAIRKKLNTEDTFLPSEFASAVQRIPARVDIVPWATGTDAQIAAMIYEARDGAIDLQEDGGWAVGDTREIEIAQFTDYNGTTHPAEAIDIVISQFGDYEECGCVMQFDFKQSISIGMRATVSSSTPSYSQWELKNQNMPILVEALPSWLRDMLIPFKCNENSNPYYVYNNLLAPRSSNEVCGVGTWGDYGVHIDYYKTDSNRIKTLGKNGGATIWWTRMGSSTNRYGFTINTSGRNEKKGYDSVYGIAPFGCL